ncbi:unnamed protein product [Chrysoparadoxa australica]
MRVAKRIAKSGMASRREAERMIANGEVKINGKVIDTPALTVTAKDHVKVRGKLLLAPPERPMLYAVHKLRGELVSRADPLFRDCMMQRIQGVQHIEGMKKIRIMDTLMPIGRLDYLTEGLVLLTDDGDFARMMEHPSTQITRVYRVRVRGHLTEEKVKAIQRGVKIDGVYYKGMAMTLDSSAKKNSWIQLSCTEGKNRQIRKVCEHLHLTVHRLQRIQYGPFKLGELQPGKVCPHSSSLLVHC